MEVTDKIKYWVDLSEYDLTTAKAMLKTRRFLYVGFMCHQSLEKLLKAAFIKSNSSSPPFTHSLIDLAKRASIYDEFTSEQKDFIDYMQPLNIQARYPTNKEKIFKTLSNKKCEEIIKETKRLSKWIKMKL